MLRFFLIACFLFAFLWSTPLQAQEKDSIDPENQNFLSKSKGERSWYYAGAVDTIGHLVAQNDKKRANCIWHWFFDNPGTKERLIEKTLIDFPQYPPSTVILGLLYKACGKFKAY